MKESFLPLEMFNEIIKQEKTASLYNRKREKQLQKAIKRAQETANRWTPRGAIGASVAGGLVTNYSVRGIDNVLDKAHPDDKEKKKKRQAGTIAASTKMANKSVGDVVYDAGIDVGQAAAAETLNISNRVGHRTAQKIFNGLRKKRRRSFNDLGFIEDTKAY